jgi:lipopolysaccharide export LptBFGC system permease protein LptF
MSAATVDWTILTTAVQQQNATIQKEIDKLSNNETMYLHKYNYKSADRYYLRYVAFLFFICYVLIFILFAAAVALHPKLSAAIKIGYVAVAATYPWWSHYAATAVIRLWNFIWYYIKIVFSRAP